MPACSYILAAVHHCLILMLYFHKHDKDEFGSCTLPLLHKEHGILEERTCFADCIAKLYHSLPAGSLDTKTEDAKWL